MPKGLRPVGRIDGSPWMADQRRFPIANEYSTKIYQYDPVALSSGNIVRGVAGQPIVGALVGVEYINGRGEKVFSNFWPGDVAATEIKATVAVSPDLLFETETTTGAGNITAAYRGAMVDFALGTGDDRLGTSGAQVGAAGGSGLMVYDVPDYPGNELGTTNRTVLVQIIKHQFRPYELST